MAQETSIFEIKVLGLPEFEQFLTKLNVAKNGLLNIAEAYKNIEAQFKKSVQNLTAEEVAAERARESRANTNRANRESKAKIERDKELNDIKVHNLRIIGEEKVLSEQIRQENLKKVSSNKQFNDSLLDTNRILRLVGATLGIHSFLDFAGDVFKAQSRIEALKLNLKSLIGDVSGANLFKGIEDFTKRTPFTIEQSIKGINLLVGSMKAAGVSNQNIADNTIKIMESLGNSAAALGDIGGEKFGRLTYAFTQVQAAGRLMGTEVRQLTEVGLPILAILAQNSGEKISDLQARVKAGQVGFQEFSKAILSAGEAGGIFGGSMTILSQTIEGKINIIKDTLFFARGRIGDAISDITKKILDFGIVLVNSLVGTSTAVDRTIGAVKVLIGTFIAYKATLATSTALILANTTATTGMLAKDGLLSTLKQILTGQINRTTLALGLETNAKIAGGVAANTFTAAELRAAAAATVLQRSLGVLVVVLGAALLAYQYLGKQQDQMAVDVKERTAGLEKEKIQFNQLTKAVMDKNVSTKTELEMLLGSKKNTQ